MNVTLEVGAVTETVEVSGAAEVVQTSTSGNYGNVLTEKILRDMPIVGTRRDESALACAAAARHRRRREHGRRLSRPWGARPGVEFTLDGIDNNDPSAGGSNFAPTRTNPDSLSELRVVTSNPHRGRGTE